MTPVVIKLAKLINAVDLPNGRKVHRKATPLLGGLSIYLGFIIGILWFHPENHFIWPIIIGATVIVLTGMIDDMIQLKPRWKFVGQSIAAISVISGGLFIEFINLPFETIWELGFLGIPLTYLWIVAITNAINLIDGLDGLAAGVSIIVLTAISIISIMAGNFFISLLTLILISSTLGFLFFNFHPAKIFMGDTGSLFLGFMISVISILGFKSITLFTLIVPIILLAVPLSDSIFAIIRRIVHKKSIVTPDKSHLHHCLMKIGFTHKGTVLLIYGLSAFFAVCAMLLTKSTFMGGFIITLIIIITIELTVEIVGLINGNYRPMLNFISRFKRIGKSQYFSKQNKDWFKH